MATRTGRGFTLVEVLIVVIILGILAAIVIPQFATATGATRKAAMVDQLQMLRVQILLFRIQHGDTAPALDGNNWDDLLNGTTYQGRPCGPYISAIPRNTVNGLNKVLVIATDPNFGDGVAEAGIGYLYNPSNGMIWATNTAADRVYNEANPDDVNN
jgi:general secretion pathway protein G